jgi:hypothetical protein
MDLSESLVAHAALAAKLAHRVPKVLNHPAIRRRHLECLARFLIQRAVATDELLVEMELRGADRTTVRAVQSVQQLWSSVIQLVESRLEEEDDAVVQAPSQRTRLEASA